MTSIVEVLQAANDTVERALSTVSFPGNQSNLAPVTKLNAVISNIRSVIIRYTSSLEVNTHVLSPDGKRMTPILISHSGYDMQFGSFRLTRNPQALTIKDITEHPEQLARLLKEQAFL